MMDVRNSIVYQILLFSIELDSKSKVKKEDLNGTPLYLKPLKSHHYCKSQLFSEDLKR